jgi:hypothetical protein
MKINGKLKNQPFLVNQLLIKAIQKIEKYELDEHKFVREYQLAVIKYVEEIFQMIGEGLTVYLGGDPTKLKKTIRVSIPNLLKSLEDHDTDGMLMKAKISKILGIDKFKKSWLKKFKFNNGKPLEPIKFKGKIKYNPKTGEPLTKKEWLEITDSIVDFLGDRIGSIEEEMIVRASMFGKLIQAMELEGLKPSTIKKFDYEQVENRFGKIPRNLQNYQQQYDVDEEEKQTIQYAIDNAGEHLSIEDGSLKNQIVSSVRRQITEGLREGKSAQQVAQDLYWMEPDERLGTAFKDKTIEAWNRDWRRIAITELKTAKANGYMLAHKKANGKKKTYFVFAGKYNPVEKQWSCNKYIGKTFLFVSEPQEEEETDDRYADYLIWPGKNNVGRTLKTQWGCIPMHPHCTHWWIRINPQFESYDEKTRAVYSKAALKDKELVL